MGFGERGIFLKKCDVKEPNRGSVVYPTDLLEKARFELEVFERVSADTSIELIDVLERAREEFRKRGIEFPMAG